MDQEAIKQINQLEGFLSFIPTWDFQKLIRLEHRIIGLFTGNQKGKCLAEGERVQLFDGRLVPIELLSPGDEVLSIGDNLKIRAATIEEVINSGDQECFEVKTKSGRKVTVSGKHPFLTVSGWKPIGELSRGDYIATPRNLFCESRVIREWWEYALLGYLIGDGGISGDSIKFSNVDDLILNEIRELLISGYTLKHRDRCNYAIVKSSGKKNFYIQWLIDLGLMGTNSHTKFVPPFIFQSPKKFIAVFLSRLFACDGWAYKEIGYCTVSRMLADDILALLLRFGIYARLRKKKTYTGGAYTIVISRGKDVELFCNEIGIFSKQKQTDLLLLENKKKDAKENSDVIPIDMNSLYKTLRKKEANNGHRGKQWEYADRKKYDLLRSARGKTISRQKLKEFDEFKDLSESDIFWDKISRIESIGIKQTYDLSVKGTHNFIAENIFVHNTAGVAYQYVLRIMGLHPVPKKNVLYFECENRAKIQGKSREQTLKNKAEYLKKHKSRDSATFTVKTRPDVCPECGAKVVIHRRQNRVFRFCAENLPTEKDSSGGQSAEIKSAQYPEFKKWLPPYLIKKDITIRNPAMTILDPNDGLQFGEEIYQGSDIIVEFTSYSQQVNATAGTKRMSVWMDEHSPYDFWEEQGPRALIEDGDLLLTLTPAMGMSWEYDAIFEKARTYVRTKAVCDYLKISKQIEETDSVHDIAVLQAATDDNPILDPDTVEALYRDMEDLDGTRIPTRRYGVFTQAVGKIFKKFNRNIHVINPRRYGITREVISSWNLARSFDFHQENPHAILWAGISPDDECFVYHEWSPSPSRWVTPTICNEIARISGMDRFTLNLIDPLASTKNPGTSKRTRDEMNTYFSMLKKGKEIPDLKEQHFCTGGTWESWNTHGTVGRDAIRRRLANSLKVGKPYNNIIVENGIKKRIPTLWIFENCKHVAISLGRWSVEEWSSNRQLVTKDKKETPAQKYSHFCTALEALFKDLRFRARTTPKRRPKTPMYFQGQR